MFVVCAFLSLALASKAFRSLLHSLIDLFGFVPVFIPVFGFYA